MKQNLKISGEVELSQSELTQAAVALLKRDRQFLSKAVTDYLKSVHAYDVKRVIVAVLGGELVVKAIVEGVGVGIKTEGQIGVSKSKGFYKWFGPYLKEETKLGKRPVSFDNAFADT